ncbi:hypothetical protein [Tissierella sp. Yu-01]|uniref:5' nucleotidase, NT5C type n=1 Tax=Tissierella sp. Yu-01 TaxID=3035694 RepID=UPI00240E6567|nr:hypothetical protein [Tissierella sp. Yu-01]WFA07710.1 hypothetical protein P3962_08170 [Tissierella sp. Yu-01]
MKRLNLCIDIDGTVTEPYYWIEKANDYFNTDIKPSDVSCYDIHKVLGVKDEDYINFYEEHGELLHREAKKRNGITQVINRLAKDHFIHFVTAREKKMFNVSLEWLNRHEIPMDTLSLLGTHNKVSKAKELNCDIFIEDRYENAIQLSEAGFVVILIDCNYNKGILNRNIHRVRSWYQIERLIQNLAGENQEKIASNI